MKATKFLILSLFFVQQIVAQELPIVQNYTPSEYLGQNQNWGISQAANKFIYIANNKGLLEFNGAKWRLYNSPNETITRSVKALGNKIFTGCYMEFGYWSRNNINQLVYTSLSKKIKNKLVNDEQFWNIIEEEGWLLFQSLNSIYLYNIKQDVFKIIRSDTNILKIFKTKKGVYFQRLNKGLYKIENGKERLISNHSIIKNNRIINVFVLDNTLLIQTKNKGFFILNNNLLTPWKTPINSYLQEKSVYNSIQLQDGSFMVGTISNGVIHVSATGNVNYQINKSNGLNNNTVLSVFEDADNGIWLGLDNGISIIHQKAPFANYKDYSGKLGSVYASIIYNNNLYLGTNQGLFYKPLNSNQAFTFVNKTKGQVWLLKEIDGTLFCGHDLGTFVVENNQAKKITATEEGTWDIKPFPNTKEKLLQGNYDGLYVLTKENNSWKLSHKLKNFNTSSRYIEFLNETEVFVNHEYQGVLKLKLNPTYTEVRSVKKEQISKGLNSSLVSFLNEIYYAYKEGVYKYDKNTKTFVKDTLLSGMYNGEFSSGKLFVDHKKKEMWAFSQDNVIQITPSKISNTLKIKKIPFSSLVRNAVTGYESILNIKENKYLLGTATGYTTINLTKFKEKERAVLLNTIKITNALDGKNTDIVKTVKKTLFQSNQNNFTFTFSTSEYNSFFQPKYQYKLEGMYNNWSTWSSNNIAVFKNLPNGSYTFKVRAKSGNTISENTETYSFTIKKPWYLTSTMVVVYIISFIVFLLFMHTLYRKYYKREQRKLIERNQRELKLSQVENEKEIIRIKNEQLKKEYKDKSKELAASIMNVAKKNEILTQIKEQLNTVEDKNSVNKVVKVINKNLKQNDDWEFFQEAFNNADSEFFKKIKTQHTNLSPNDLKLCAYLRLNLSSKEIAPLFNISVRSVEIKRYRLRKKLNLSQKDNLVEYILSI